MSGAFFFIGLLGALALGGLFIWGLRGARSRPKGCDGLGVLESAPLHLCNMAQIRQSLDAGDLAYARENGGRALAGRLRRERRRVTLLYLSAIRRDFDQLLRIARVVALLSPEVSGAHEYERLRLSVFFRLRFQFVRARLWMGNPSMPDVSTLGEMVSSLAVQMEKAMAELGERAALAAELALQSDQ
jgi:hypothetical protein